MTGPYALWRNVRVVTLHGSTPWGMIERGALVTRGAEIAWVGPEIDLAANLPIEAEHDLGGALVTPPAARVRARRSAPSNSASSLAARVAATVERMPPPARAICS